jgi:serine/threonine protein kinase
MTDRRLTERSIFEAAIETGSPEERDAYLDQACGSDAGLRQEVEALLAAHDRLAIVHPAGRAPRLAATVDEPAVSESLGTVIGPYKLLQQIGEGGMGAVFMAEQTQPVQRKVALKLIKSGMDSRQIVARFEAERQALALMDHPNIAKVHDAGTTEDGRPYFVMELVKGVPITRYCDERRLTPQQRLELFVPVCQAVQHAHQKGIIHRDLKPSNVMVCLYDGKPVPKVIDFGVAKAAGPKLTEKTLFTEVGSVVGTLEYMSPEQAELNQLDIDTRSDIYSLGVLLYELLTGTTPLERKRFQAVAFLEVLRLIREEESPRPSTRLSTAEGLPTIAANRGLEPKKLSGLVRGELDWIVMKTLEKDRNRRYESANGLALDVQRYLNDEPVQACPPSQSYRLKKFLRRNKGPVLAASMVVLALVGGIIGTTLGLLHAQASAETAQDEAWKTGQERDRANDARAEERKAKDAESRQRKLAEAARDRAADALDAMTSDVAPEALTQQQLITPKQKEFLTKALEFYRELLKEKLADEATQHRLALAASRVANIEYALGRKEAAALMIRQARDFYAQLATEFPSPKHRQDLARCQNNLGILLARLGRHQEAEIEDRAALFLRKQLAADYPKDPEHLRELANSHTGLGARLAFSSKWDEAEIEYRAAGAILEDLVAKDSRNSASRYLLAQTRHNLGLLFSSQGKREKAAAEFRAGIAIRQELAREDPRAPKYRDELALGHHNLAEQLVPLKKADEAASEYRAAIILLSKLAKESPSAPVYRIHLAGSLHGLAMLLHHHLKNPEQAEIEYRAAIGIQEGLLDELPAQPNYHHELSRSRWNLGNLLRRAGKQELAETEFRAAVGHLKRAAEYSTDPQYLEAVAASHTKLGNVLRDWGKRDPAVKEYRAGIEVQKKLVAAWSLMPTYRATLATWHRNLAALLVQFGKPDEAELEIRAALQLRKQLPQDFPNGPQARLDLADMHNFLGVLLFEAKKWAPAELELRAALGRQQQVVDEFPGETKYAAELGNIHNNLGNVVALAGRRKEALASFNQAVALLAPLLKKEPANVNVRQALFGSHLFRAVTLEELKRYQEASPDRARALELAPPEKKTNCHVGLMYCQARAEQWDAALKDADQLAKGDSRDLFYDCACVYALAHAKLKDDQHAVRAVALLRQAVGKGYRDVAHMKEDTDLDSLRARADFRQLVAELEQEKSSRPPSH